MKKEKEKNKASDENPYLDSPGRREWNDRYQNLAQVIRNWQLACALMISIALLLAIAVTILASKDKLQPYAVEVNQGMPYALRSMNAISPKDGLIISYALTQFIANSRTRLNDTDALRNNLHKAYAFTTSKATELLTDYYIKHDPFKEASDETVEVKVINALSVGGHTWQIVWEETKRNVTNGQVEGKTRWMANITYQIGEPEADKITENPFGIYINDFSWSQSTNPV